MMTAIDPLKREQQLDELAASVARKKGWTTRRARRWIERQAQKVEPRADDR